MKHREYGDNSLKQMIATITNITHKFYTTTHLSDDGVEYQITPPTNLKRIDFLIKEIIYGGSMNLSENDISDIAQTFNSDFMKFLTEEYALKVEISVLGNDDVLKQELTEIKHFLDRIYSIINSYREKEIIKQKEQEITDALNEKKSRYSIFFRGAGKNIMKRDDEYIIFNTETHHIEEECGNVCINKYKFGDNKVMIFKKFYALDLSEEEIKELLEKYKYLDFEMFTENIKNTFGDNYFNTKNIKDNDNMEDEDKKYHLLNFYTCMSYPIFLINEKGEIKKADEVQAIQGNPKLTKYYGEKTLVLPIQKDGKNQQFLINNKKLDYFETK